MNVWELLLAVYIASLIVTFAILVRLIREAKRSTKTYLSDKYGMSIDSAELVIKKIADFKPFNIFRYAIEIAFIPIINVKVVLNYGLHVSEYEKWYIGMCIKKLESKYHDKLVMIKEAIDGINEKYGEKKCE